MNLLQESFKDMFANPISFFVLLLIIILSATLLIAIWNSKVKNFLITIKLLDKNESPQSFLTWLLIIVIGVKLIQAFLLQPFIVDGRSMSPTLESGNFIFVDKISYLLGSPNRGDVAVFKLYESGNFNGKYLVKRIIGLPLERVVVENGVTTIYNNEHPKGMPLEESFIAYRDIYKNVDVKLSENEFFVMGDNRSGSYDSRSWGALKKEDIRGRALFLLYPLNESGFWPGKKEFSF